MARDRDHHGRTGFKRAFNQVAQAFAVALSLAKAVDDQEIGAGIERIGDCAPAFRNRPISSRQPLALGSKSCASNSVSPLWISTGRQAGVGALSGLYHPDNAKALRIQLRCETAQNRVGILMVVIDEGREVAFSIEHDGLDHRLRDILPRNVASKITCPKVCAGLIVFPLLPHARSLGIYLPRMHL